MSDFAEWCWGFLMLEFLLVFWLTVFHLLGVVG
jgi:hypothetical protein